MTIRELRALLAEWCQSMGPAGQDFSAIRSLTDFLEKVLYGEYEPAGVAAQGEFAVRLARWIGGAGSDEDRRALYLLLGRLVFFGREQMVAGYRTAYSRHVASWLMAVEGLSFFDQAAEVRMEEAVAATAFTEITDSFGLGDFIKWNNIDGHGLRYTWEQHLARWERMDFLEEVMRIGSDAPRRNLVLLEDFVGSGSQMEVAAASACSLPENYQVLLCPIVICPEGAERARALADRHAHFSYAPVMELPEDMFVAKSAIPGEHPHHPHIRRALVSLHAKVRGTPGSWPQETPPFGYRDTGAVFCKHDNCPDNTVPVLHHRSDCGWSPLFPRTARDSG